MTQRQSRPRPILSIKTTPPEEIQADRLITLARKAKERRQAQEQGV